jgi:hypothetical protein
MPLETQPPTPVEPPVRAPFVSLLAAKVTGAALVGGVLATAAVGSGAVALQQVADTAPVVVVSPTPSPTDTATPTDTPSPVVTDAPSPTDTASPAAVDPASPLPALPTLPTLPASVAPTPAAVHVAMSNATVTSIDGQSLVVTAGATTYTWVLSDLTRYSGFFKNPADIMPGMVVNVQGLKDGDTYTAQHVVTPGKNKKIQPKPAKPAHGKGAAGGHGKGHK